MSSVTGLECRLRLRVRYSETDQMGTFYNSRALEWFEVARTELLRQIRSPQGNGYAAMEASGIMLPLVEAHVEYLGRARYDDELDLSVSARMSGRARMRFDVEISQACADGPAVARGYTVHAITDESGKPIRPPEWLEDAVGQPGRGPSPARARQLEMK